MARRIIAPKPSVEHVHQIQSTIRAMEASFKGKNDPEKVLADEIEAFRKLIWQCVRGQEKSKAISNQQNKVTQAEKPAPKAVDEGPKKPNANRVNIEFRVNAMKVVELRKELRKRNLDTNGLKKQLQARLRKAMFEEIGSEQENEQEPVAEPMTKVKNAAKIEEAKPTATEIISAPENITKEIEKSIKGSNTNVMKTSKKDVVVKAPVASFKPVPKIKNDVTISKKTSIESKEQPEKAKLAAPASSEVAMEVDEKIQSKSGDHGSNNVKNYWKALSKPVNQKSQISKLSAPKTSIPAKKTKSPIKMVVKKTYKPFSIPSENDSIKDDMEFSESKDDFSVVSESNGPSKETSEPPVSSGPVGLTKTNSVKDMVSKIQNNGSISSMGSTMNMNSTLNMSSTLKATGGLSKNLQAKKDARMARMAEIRGKSKPIITSKVVLAPKDYSSTLSSLNAVSAPASSKKKNLAMQMREKAAAAARKENMSANNMQASLNGTGKRNLPTSTFGNLGKDNQTTSMKEAVTKKPKIASPMDTYEISDREEDSDSSDSEGENEKQKKKIPGWAQKTNLLPALEQQYNGCVEGRRVDPDDIFPEVQTCDLEAIFGGKKSRYTRRTSSGNWARDKVTVAEKLVYKRTMGFASSATDA